MSYWETLLESHLPMRILRRIVRFLGGDWDLIDFESFKLNELCYFKVVDLKNYLGKLNGFCLIVKFYHLCEFCAESKLYSEALLFGSRGLKAASNSSCIFSKSLSKLNSLKCLYSFMNDRIRCFWVKSNISLFALAPVFSLSLTHAKSLKASSIYVFTPMRYSSRCFMRMFCSDLISESL